MIIIIGYGCQMGVKSVIDVSTIHAIKGKSKLYANSFGTKRPWVRIPSRRLLFINVIKRRSLLSEGSSFYFPILSFLTLRYNRIPVQQPPVVALSYRSHNEPAPLPSSEPAPPSSLFHCSVPVRQSVLRPN